MSSVIPGGAGVEASVDARPGSTPVERESMNGAKPNGLSPEDRSTLWIAVAGAVAYCSWPLAFLVNPSLAGSALASSFEGRSEPFSWLFIVLDCVAGLCTVVVSVRILHSRHRSRSPGRTLVLALLGYAAFGVTTAVDAVVPLSCGGSSAQACAAQLWPLTPDDLLTAIAVLGLFVAVLAILVERLVRTPRPRLVPATIVIPAVGWCSVGCMVLVGSTSSVSAAAAQYAFLTVTSLLMLIVPLEAAGVLRSRPARSQPRVPALERGFCGNQRFLDRRGTATAYPSGTPRPAETSRGPVALDTRPPRATSGHTGR